MATAQMERALHFEEVARTHRLRDQPLRSQAGGHAHHSVGSSVTNGRALQRRSWEICS
jgi:hypothetical protein